MRVFHVSERFEELPGLPERLPAAGFLWVSSARREFEVQLPQLHAALPHETDVLLGILQEASQWWAEADVPFWAFLAGP